MRGIPADVEVAVRAAGQSFRPYAGELPDVYRRARRRRTKRRLAAALAAVAVTAGLAGGAIAVRREAPYQPAAVTPAQRLFLSGAAGTFTTGQQTDPVELGDRAVGELTPDGAIVAHPVPGTAGTARAIGLPDGRIVSLGPRVSSLTPEPEMVLTVEQPGGDMVQRDIRRKGEPVALVAANDTTAYLWRPPGLVEHNLATGLERLAILPPVTPPSSTLLPEVDASDVVGDKLVVAARSCRPLLLDLRTLSALRDLPVRSAGCDGVIGLRLSPSALRVAVAYRQERSVRVAVLSTEDGTVLADRPLVTVKAGDVTGGLAWLDERTVQAVAVPTSPGQHFLTPLTIAT